MKFKALRTKKEPKEFVIFEKTDKETIMYTCALPNPQPTSATLEGMKEYYKEYSPLPDSINLDDLELVELDCIESGVVGADIRNKLTPLLNLIALVDILLKDEVPDKREAIKGLLKKEMETSKICIKYLTKLL